MPARLPVFLPLSGYIAPVTGQGISPDDLAMGGALAIYSAFVEARAAFDAISERAPARFTARDWAGMQADAVERLECTPRQVDRAVARIGTLLGKRRADHAFWQGLRRAYASLLSDDPAPGLGETFYNSVSRRLQDTIGIDVDTDFFSIAPPDAEDAVSPSLVRRYPWHGDAAALLQRILSDAGLGAGWVNAAGDAARVGAELARRLAGLRGTAPTAVEMLRPAFYRNKGAYLVGRLLRPPDRPLPFVLALIHPRGGLRLDTVLIDEHLVSIVFSFTRSYFHVPAPRPRDLLAFLRSILPRKPLSELYASLGHHKHGKTEMFRDLARHLAESDDRFIIAPGSRGLVMLVFTLKNYDIVFKIIRDRFERPKAITRRQVMERYRLVFRRDRVGRLVDAQEFTRLRFPKDRFAPDLLAELHRHAAGSVREDDGWLVIAHAYSERRLTPLNLFLRDATADEAAAVVDDYGRAMKELAAANIFPGDFLLKNFGVTRHGRVVFYDYDELCLVTDCNFRVLPPPRTPEEEMDAETWFAVGEHDIFPEEFRRFLGMPPALAELFERRHGELFTVDWWRQLQDRHRRGEMVDFFPYPRPGADGGAGRE